MAASAPPQTPVRKALPSPGHTLGRSMPSLRHDACTQEVTRLIPAGRAAPSCQSEELRCKPPSSASGTPVAGPHSSRASWLRTGPCLAATPPSPFTTRRPQGCARPRRGACPHKIHRKRILPRTIHCLAGGRSGDWRGTGAPAAPRPSFGVRRVAYGAGRSTGGCRVFPEVGDAGVSLPGAGAAESARSPGGSRGARPGGLGTWAPAPRWPRARGRGRKGGPAFGRTDAAPGSARSRAPRVSRPRRPSLGPSPGRPRWQGKHLLSISRCVDAARPGPPVCLWGARASPRTRRAKPVAPGAARAAAGAHLGRDWTAARAAFST